MTTTHRKTRPCGRELPRRGAPAPFRGPFALLLAAALSSALTPARSAAATGSLGGSATFTHAEGDRAAQLNRANRNDGEFNTLRLLLQGELEIAPRVRLNLEYLLDQGAYGNSALSFLNPWVTLSEVFEQPWLNVQIGKLPLSFGTWGERVHSLNNPVIGVPLLAEYHTDLRYDVLPANGDILIARRGMGQIGFSYTPGGAGFKGMPVAYEPCWDTGVEAFGARGILEYSAALTYGSVGASITNGQENNDEPGVTGRLGLSHLPGPLFGARVGLSASTGAYLPRTVRVPAGHRVEEYDQIVFGADLEYGLGPVIVRGEAARNRWELPEDRTPERWLPAHVDNTCWYLDARVDVCPWLFLGGRYDSMTFDRITAPDGRSETWDANLHRVELGATWRPARNWSVRHGYQMWRYATDRHLNADLYALQLRVQF